MTAGDRMLAWRDKKKRVKMSKMMKKSIACAKIQVSVTKGDRLKIKSSKADVVWQKTKVVKSFSEAVLVKYTVNTTVRFRYHYIHYIRFCFCMLFRSH